MPDLTTMYAKISQIITDLGTGAINYDEALKLVQELTAADPTILDDFGYARDLLKASGFSSQADVGKTPPAEVLGPIQKDVLQFPGYGLRPEETEPFGAYTRGLASAGLNAGIGGGPFGEYLQGRAAPTSAVFAGQLGVRGLLPRGQLEPENAFEEFSRQTRGGNLGLQAQTAFQGLMNKARGGDVNALDLADPARAFLTPKTATQEGMAASLAREAARGRLGGYAASMLLPSNEDILQQYRGGPSGAQNTALMAYLQRAFGL